MTNKIRCVISGIFYPVTMMGYFIRAFERRNDVELYLTGPFTGNKIPWKGGMTLPQKYVKMPNFPLPEHAAQITNFDPKIVEAQLPWEPDLWLQVNAGWSFGNRPNAKVVALIKTDPHALSPQHYSLSKSYSDITFGMQEYYREDDEIHLPYAYDPTIHYPMKMEKEYDACLIGLQYEHRNQLVNGLRNKGLKVFYETGIVYDEYREIYNKSKIALSWSSLQDLPARVWEALGMGLPLVANRIPDMEMFFNDRSDYLGFSTVNEAIENVMVLLEDDVLRESIARCGHKTVKLHTYDLRVEQILMDCELL